MERVATDVAKPPLPGGELPGFDELLAKGSFHARLAQARVERAKALAESGDDDFILNTSRKPWDRDERGPGRRDRLTSALHDAIGAQAAAPVVARNRREPQSARGRASGAVSAKVVPIRQEDVLWLGLPVLLEGTAGTAAAPVMPAAEVASEPHQPVLSEASRRVAPVAAPSRAGWRVVAVGGGFLGGLAISAALMMTLPRPEETALSRAAPAAPAATLPAIVAPAVSAAAPQVLPDADAEASPGVPAPMVASAAPSPSVRALPPADGHDAAPSARMASAGPDVPVRLDGVQALTLPGMTAATGPGSLPRPALRPEFAAVAVLALVAPAETPPAMQSNPAPAAPGFAGRVIVNAPESVGEAGLADLVEGLGAAGLVLSGPNRVDITIRESNVRFFHSEDAAAAKSVASQLGVRLRDFTSFSPAPPEGTIEVWLAGQGNAAATAPAKPRSASAQPTMTAEERALKTLRNRILQQLRNGEHL